VGDTGTILTSNDAITWSLRSSGTSASLFGIAWSATQSQFVAVGWSNTVFTSPDGVTWTKRS
jgi:hypothetical protein